MPRLSPILTLLIALLAAAQADSAPDLRADLLRRSDVGAFAPAGAFRARLAMSDAKGRHEVEIFRSDRVETLIRFLDAKERGKYVVQTGGQQWLLAPGAKKPVHLKSAYRLYGGATLDEILGVHLAEAYAIESVAEEDAPTGKLVVFELRAKSEAMLFPEVRYTVREEAERPVTALYRLRSGKAATEVEFLEWNEKGRTYARRILLKDLLRRKPPIEVEVLELEESPVPEGLFDLDDATARKALPIPVPSSAPE